jgi:hypothetical protein
MVGNIPGFVFVLIRAHLVHNMIINKRANRDRIVMMSRTHSRMFNGCVNIRFINRDLGVCFLFVRFILGDEFVSLLLQITSGSKVERGRVDIGSVMSDIIPKSEFLIVHII